MIHIIQILQIKKKKCICNFNLKYIFIIDYKYNFELLNPFEYISEPLCEPNMDFFHKYPKIKGARGRVKKTKGGGLSYIIHCMTFLKNA